MPSKRSILIATLAAVAGCAAQSQSTAQTPPRELFLFLYRPGPTWREGVPMREQGLAPHGAYMQQLLNQGRLVAGGGFTSDDGGMAIVRCADIDEARAILAADPAITSGIFTADLRHWRPRFYSDEPLVAPQ